MISSPAATQALYIGLMSGTSLDGVDAVLLRTGHGSLQVLGACHHAMPSELRHAFLTLNSSGPDELHAAALAANALAQLYARAVHGLLSAHGLSATDIRAIGAHGQTVRHRPAPPGSIPGHLAPWAAYTLQINQPALLAELTGIAVVADFRSRDVAAGGQGAPLVPGFHQAMFSMDGVDSAVVNVGGMANVTLLHADGQVSGFDTGPGNVLMDIWCEQHTGHTYDAGGDWARSGTVQPELLQRLQADPFFALSGPRSTGRDHFNQKWLAEHLQSLTAGASKPIAPADVQATLCALTAWSITRTLPPSVKRTVVCGGGAFNQCFMSMLEDTLAPCPILSSDHLGLPAMQVEAAAFAWLAMRTCLGLPGNVTAVTAAQGPRILGAIYPA